MSSQPRRKKSKPSATTRVRKINVDLLSSQLSQSQSRSQALQDSPQRNAGINSQSVSQRRVLQTPVRRNVAPNALVKKDESIFSPLKSDINQIELINDHEDEEENEVVENEYNEENTSDSENEVVEVNSDAEFDLEDNDRVIPPTTKRVIRPLKKYTVPLNTQNWQQLPPQVHAELSTLLQLLVPPSLEANPDSAKYFDALQNTIVRPLAKKFSTVYLPPLQKSTQKKLETQRTSGDLNLTTLHQEQTRLLSSYDINTKQLDTLKLQLSKEKEMLATEQKYLSQLRDKANAWRKRKNERMARLVSELGPEFSAINQSLDTKNSGIDGADDVDMILDTKEIGKDGNISQIEASNELKFLEKELQKLENDSSQTRDFQIAVQQLLNNLQMEIT